MSESSHCQKTPAHVPLMAGGNRNLRVETSASTSVGHVQAQEPARAEEPENHSEARGNSFLKSMFIIGQIYRPH
jgi:hypothetical protein